MPTESALPLLRLLQLVSPSLPTGAFTYSQGIEWSVEAGWIRDAADLEAWLSDQMRSMLARVDLPLLLRMRQAIVDRDKAQLDRWIDALLASRETRELREEESNRGRALADLLGKLELAEADAWRDDLARCQAAGFAFAAARWRIPADQLALGYAWGWLENQVAAAIKLVPLGQTDGQRVQLALAGELPRALEQALATEDDAIGASAPALAIASARHETQYTRLFRS